MRVLGFVPHSRTYEPSIQSILALEWDGCLDVFFAADGDEPDAHRYDNITAKYRRGREMCLEGGYDALLTIEDDILVPPDALVKLAAVEADVAYGLVTWRYAPYRWSAVLELDAEGHHLSLDERPKQARKAWGKVTPVVGCGLFCTLIRRHVLEAVDFRRDMDFACCDWDFALDCEARGFSQQADLSVVCGHLLEDGGVVWPDADGERFYRLEAQD